MHPDTLPRRHAAPRVRRLLQRRRAAWRAIKEYPMSWPSFTRTLAPIVAVVAALGGPMPSASAAALGTPTTYSNLVWSTSFTASGLTTCTQLVIDATGDLTRSDALVLYGALNCNNGVYGVTGSVFTASDATLHITMMVGGYTVSCPRIAGYAGNCTVYDADWVSRGSGVIQLL
jgi:hypothetical protein